jgi:adenylate cyclase
MESGEKYAKLILTVEGKPDQITRLENLLTIGRSRTCDIVLDDDEASRNHAEIRFVGGRYRLSDLGSVNGTWLNGRRVAIPRDLESGDEIRIGRAKLVFQGAPGAFNAKAPATLTKLAIRTERVVVLVADIRNYTGMSEALPVSDFSQLVASWFREGSEIIESHGGIIDKFIGDAIMAFWISTSKSDTSNEVNQSLKTAKELVGRASVFSTRLSTHFPGYMFDIGIGLNLGSAILANVGTGQNQSFTAMGDSVNVAFRLEALTKEKGSPVVVSRSIVDWAASKYEFLDLGEATVKGRKEPIAISALKL